MYCAIKKNLIAVLPSLIQNHQNYSLQSATHGSARKGFRYFPKIVPKYPALLWFFSPFFWQQQLVYALATLLWPEASPQRRMASHPTYPLVARPYEAEIREILKNMWAKRATAGLGNSASHPLFKIGLHSTLHITRWEKLSLQMSRYFPKNEMFSVFCLAAVTGKATTRREGFEEVGQGLMRGGTCQAERKIPIRSTLLMTVRRPFVGKGRSVLVGRAFRGGKGCIASLTGGMCWGKRRVEIRDSDGLEVTAERRRERKRAEEGKRETLSCSSFLLSLIHY